MKSTEGGTGRILYLDVKGGVREKADFGRWWLWRNIAVSPPVWVLGIGDFNAFVCATWACVVVECCLCGESFKMGHGVGV